MNSRATFGVIVFVLGLPVVQPVAGQVSSASGHSAFPGVWELVSATDHRPDGTALPWMGKAPTGTIIYTKDGRMAVQFMRDPRPAVAGKMWTSDGRDLLPNASAGEIRDAFTGYYAYFGIWRIDETRHAIIHHVVSSLRPEEVGLDYVRPYEVSGDRLQFSYPVTAADGEVRTRVIVFKRAERFQ